MAVRRSEIDVGAVRRPPMRAVIHGVAAFSEAEAGASTERGRLFGIAPRAAAHEGIGRMRNAGESGAGPTAAGQSCPR